MRDEGKARGIIEWQGRWDTSNMQPPKDCPKQTDGTSCGVFVCCSADCLSGGANIHRWDLPALCERPHRALPLDRYLC
jgi:hypothetical protein